MATEHRGIRSDRRPIVVVHDEPAVAALIRLVVEERGIPCRTAASYRAARGVLSDCEPAAVISDLHLPDGTGTGVFEEVRRRFGPDVSLALVTADYLAEREVRSWAAAMNVLVHVGILRLPTLADLVEPCTQYSDCAPFVCVSNECVPCWNDDYQCRGTEDWYCDSNTGDCTDGEECLPLGYPLGTGQCDYCTLSGPNMCPAPDYLCGGGGYCTLIG